MIDLRPHYLNGQAIYTVVVTDENGERPYHNQVDLGVEHYRARCVDRLMEITGRPADQLEKEILAKIQDDELSIAKRRPPRCSIRKLIDDYPKLHPPIIDGLLRERETLNIISVSKIGKSWLLYGLQLSIVTGDKWLGRFATKRGRVLLIDNELHRPTIANRIKTVAEAMAVAVEDYLDTIEVWPLRGELQDIYSIGRELESVRDEFAFIAIDAKYRAIPAGASENDNAAESLFYNEVDRLADITGSALGMVHHSSKGSQAEKRITDVGAGAGAQSRAADAHLILREHEESGAVVLDAAVRSFKPVEPMVLRWKFPLWIPDDDLDPEHLKGRKTKSEERQDDRDYAGKAAIREALKKGPATIREIRRRTGGMGKERCERLVDALEVDDEIHSTTTTVRGNECREYSLVA